jgi:putative DNA primase/helicase
MVALEICLWKNKYTTTPEPATVSWDQLCDLLSQFSPAIDQDQAKLWSPTKYLPGTTRGAAGVELVYCLVLDVDCGIVVEDVSQLWIERGLSYVVYSTAHHLKEKHGQPAVPRWRVVFPLKEPVPGASWSALYPRLATYLIGTAWDPACKDPSRLSWLPMSAPDHPHFSLSHPGMPLDINSAPELPPELSPPPSPGSSPPRRGESPGDDFSSRGDHVQVLINNGWRIHGRSGDNELWTRPDKPSGTGGTWHVGKRVFYCFTSSTHLDPMRGYSLFQLFSLLEHRGDFSAAARGLARKGFGAPETLSTSNSSSDPGPIPDEPENNARQIIHITTNMPDVVDQLEDAILKLRPRKIFQRGGRLVRITVDANPPRGLSKVIGATAIGAAPIPHLTEMASLSADWLRLDKRSGEWGASIPPDWAIKMFSDRGKWTLPPITGIAEAPTLRPNGTVIENPGYDEETGIMLAMSDNYPAVPVNPTILEARKAINDLLEIFSDFPIMSDHDRSAIIAALLSVVCRSAINGPVPLFTIDARAAGTGKSLLVDVISTISCGRKAARMTQAHQEAEEAKRLLAIAIEGTPLVLIDNLTAPLGSGALDASLTSGFVTDRVLGVTETRTVPWRAVVFVTGNNIQIKSDTGRRVIPITLDAETERPEERTGWKHDPLLDWVLENRPRLVVSCLTIVRAFFCAGKPIINRIPIGSFESWDDMIRAPLMWLGMADPTLGRARIREEADVGMENLRNLLHAWWDNYGSRPVGISSAIGDAKSVSATDLRDALGACDSKWRGSDTPITSRTVAWTLKRYRGRILDGLRFVLAISDSNRGHRWAVEDMDRKENQAEPEENEEDLNPAWKVSNDTYYTTLKTSADPASSANGKNQVPLPLGKWWERKSAVAAAVSSGTIHPDDDEKE